MDRDIIKRIIYGVLIAKLPMKEYLSIPSNTLSLISDNILDELIKEKIVNV